MTACSRGIRAMKFAIALFSPPHAPASRRALRFAEAVLASGHEIVRLFFYRDGVYNASCAMVAPQDELDMAAQWRAFVAEHRLDSVVCIAAALRRGVLNAEEARRYEREKKTRCSHGGLANTDGTRASRHPLLKGRNRCLKCLRCLRCLRCLTPRVPPVAEARPRRFDQRLAGWQQPRSGQRVSRCCFP